MQSPVITPLKQLDIKDVLAFLRLHYGQKYYGADATHFNWLYQGSPCDWFTPHRDRGYFPGNAIIGGNGTLHGIHLYLPFDARTPWGGTVGIFDEEWINDGTVKGGGRALASHLMRQVDVYCGLGCNDLSENAFKKIGLTFRSEIPRLVAVLDHLKLSALLEQSGFASDIAHLPMEQAPSASWNVIENCAAIPTSLINTCREQIAFGAPHSREWLTWRFDRHPYITYQIVAPHSDGENGLAVIRIEQSLGTEFRVARIVDLLAPKGKEGHVLLAAASFAATQSCIMIDYMAASIDSAMRAQKAAAHSGIMLDMNPHVPYMYQPCTFGSKSNVNMVIWASGKVDLNSFSAVKSDSTQDVVRTPETAARLR